MEGVHVRGGEGGGSLGRGRGILGLIQLAGSFTLRVPAPAPIPVPAVDQLPRGSPLPVAPNWCHSTCQLTKYEFEWTIHQFELRFKSRLESTEFSPLRLDYMSYVLRLDENGIVLRQCTPGRKCRQSIRVNTAFVNHKREKVFNNQTVVHEGATTPFPVNSTPIETLLQKSNNLIVNGNLTIYCQVETYCLEKKLKGQIANVAEEDKHLSHKEDVNKDLANFFENMDIKDVTFNVRGEKIPAHRAILAARSRVFAAMFAHPTKENLTGVVDVPDIEGHVFKELLRYIYTGQVPNDKMDDVAEELLAAADKYLLGRLKYACGDHLVSKLCPESCVKMLSLHENDPAYYLMDIVTDYCLQFPAEVMATDGWKKANEENPPWFANVEEMLLNSLAF